MAASSPAGAGVGIVSEAVKREASKSPKKMGGTSAAEVLDLTLSSDEDVPVASTSRLPHHPPLPPSQAVARAAAASDSVIQPFSPRASSPVRCAPVLEPLKDSPPPSPRSNGGSDKGKKRARSRSPEVVSNKRAARSVSSPSSSSSRSSKNADTLSRSVGIKGPGDAVPAASGAKEHRPRPLLAAVPPSLSASSSFSYTPVPVPVASTSTAPNHHVTPTPSVPPPHAAHSSSCAVLPRPPVPKPSSRTFSPAPIASPRPSPPKRKAPAPTAPAAPPRLPSSSSSKHTFPAVNPPQPRPNLDLLPRKKLKGPSPTQRTLLRHPRDPTKHLRCRPPPRPPPLTRATSAPGTLAYLLARHPGIPVVLGTSSGLLAGKRSDEADDSWDDKVEERWDWISSEEPDRHTATYDTFECENKEGDKVRKFRAGRGPKSWDWQDEAKDLADRRWAPWEELPFRCTPLDTPFGTGVMDAFDGRPMRDKDRKDAEEKARKRRKKEKKGKGKAKEPEKEEKRASFGFIETRTFVSGSGGPALFESLARIEDPDQSTDSEDETDSEAEMELPAPWFATMSMPVARQERRRLKKERRREREGRSAVSGSTLSPEL